MSLPNQLTKTEQSIYNCFLKHFRNGEPYQPRKDFSGMDPNTVVFVKRLGNFFNKFQHIKWDDFFGAPRSLHPDEKCPPLKFFMTRAAIKAYSLSIKQKENQSPDLQIDKIKDGLRFIAMFCLKNKIALNQYLKFQIGIMPAWMQHYREHHINPYCLMELGDLDTFKTLAEDEQAIWSSEFFKNLSAIKNRYHISHKTKKIVKEATEKVKIFIDTELKNSKSVIR